MQFYTFFSFWKTVQLLQIYHFQLSLSRKQHIYCNRSVDVICIDFCKAFDQIYYFNLLHKQSVQYLRARNMFY